MESLPLGDNGPTLPAEEERPLFYMVAGYKYRSAAVVTDEPAPTDPDAVAARRRRGIACCARRRYGPRSAVGFLGDGVNDVAALRVVDAGIAADTAADVAKQAADLILLDKDLAVVARGVVEGRRTLANTMKYVKITASSNFGNVLSVVAASVLLPFLPMLPIQLMVQNLLYDTAQLAIPWDRVDRDYLRIPQRWRSGGLIGFMLTFGTLSSVFDLATFAALWWLFGASDSPTTFQTGWFIEGLLTQLLVVLVLRSRTLPWRGKRPARVVLIAATSTAPRSGRCCRLVHWRRRCGWPRRRSRICCGCL